MEVAFLKFTKQELVATIFIFAVLIAISTPNFILSLMRGRDQNRKDDMGAIQKALSNYLGDFREFPHSTEDGRIIACKRPEDEVVVDNKGELVVDLIPCEWGKDKFYDLTPGSSRVYMESLPGDPDAAKGVRYVYLSDGKRFQLFSSLESNRDVEYDKNIIARNLSCGTKVCNLGRHYACVLTKTLEECEQEAINSVK